MLMSSPAFKAGDNVNVKAVVASVDTRRNTATLAVGWGPNRSIITVPSRLVERPLPKALVEAASWANDLYGEGK